MGLLTCHMAKPICWHQVVVKESIVFITGCKARRTDSSGSKDPNSPMAVREGFFKTVRERGLGVCDQLVHNSLIGWWWGNRALFWESQSSAFWFQPVWSLHACGQHAVNFLCLVEVSVSAKQLKDMAQVIIYSPWGGAKTPWLCLMAKVLLFCLDYFPLFLCFLTSLIKFVLWNLGEAKTFLQTRGGEHGDICPWEGPTAFFSVSRRKKRGWWWW